MSNPNKQRGTAWESAVRDYLNDRLGLYVPHWRELPAGITKFRNPADPLNVKRQAQEGNHDIGDLHAWPVVVECKDVKSPAVPTWLRQAEVEATHAGFPYGIAVHKVRNHSVRDGRVHIAVPTWHRMAEALRAPVDGWGFVLCARGSDESKWYYTTNLWTFSRVIMALRHTTTHGYEGADAGNGC